MCSRASGSRILYLVIVALALASCGGSNTNYPGTYTVNPVVENYTIGGSITGLTAGSVVLANGSTTVSVAADTSSWQFSSTFAPGTSYSITVQTQPSTEKCTIVSGAAGSNTGNVANVIVVCGYGLWNWEGGSNTVNAAGSYGTQGAAATTNVPGARQAASTWTDSSGNFWLFGGVGYTAAGTTGYLNDLWQYSPSTHAWTWVAGSNTVNGNGVYGTLGTAAAANVPGAREGAVTWTDSSGNFWLFGGIGYGASGTVVDLSDLWRYTPGTGQWTWIAGSSTGNGNGVYGTLGTAAATNAPGARRAAVSWIDSSGNLWLFGGVGYAATGAEANLNDLWRFTPGSGQWTWIGGGNGVNATGVYGTEQTAAATNVPGARYAASGWIDSSGNLWLFGGYGYDSSGSLGKLGDLWEYSPSSGQWTWVLGRDAANVSGYYGTLGVVVAGAAPGARQGATTWIDSTGRLLLFGGVGYDATGIVGNLNDLWRFDPTAKQWTWISGGYAPNGSGVYGTLGTGVANDVAGARSYLSSWTDSSGNLWLFGGYGYDSIGTLGYLNDLWAYTP